MLVNEKVFEIEECEDIFKYLDTLEVEYRKPYMRFGKTVHVPRGQASFTFSPDIHYDYKVSGGSPPNIVMSDELKDITKRVNEVLGTNFNTILLNKYKDGNDCIGFHQDRENGWAPYSGFATLSFGAERDFQIRNKESNETSNILHKNGYVLHLPYPMNQDNLHGVPKRSKVKDCRISLTFREIIDTI